MKISSPPSADAEERSGRKNRPASLEMTVVRDQASVATEVQKSTARNGCATRSDGRLGLAAGTRQAAEPGQQGGEMRRVLLWHGCEFESQSIARLKMAHDGLGADLAFLDQKIEPSLGAHRAWAWGTNKQTSGAQVQDAG